MSDPFHFLLEVGSVNEDPYILYISCKHAFMSLQSGLKFEPSELCGQLPLNIVLEYTFLGGNPKP